MKPGRGPKGGGCLLKVNGSPCYYAQWYSPLGKQVRMSTKTTVRQKANAFLRDRVAERDKGQAAPTDLRKVNYGTLRAMLLDNYLTKGNRTLITRPTTGQETIGPLQALDNYFGYSAINPGPSVVTITTDTAAEFIRKRLAEGIGHAAVNRSLACLRRMLYIAKAKAKIQAVPKIDFLREPRPRKGFLEPAKFLELLALLPSHLRPLISFLYYSGCRLGESLQIQWSQVDLDAAVVRFEEEQTKTDEARTVPLHSSTLMLLRGIEPKEGLVFDGTNLRKSWQQACSVCGLGTVTKMTPKDGWPWYKYDGLIVHDLRRSAVRNLIRAGVSEKVAMDITGHKTRAVFDRYNISNVTDVQLAMRKVELSGLGENKLIVGTPRSRKSLKGP